MDDVQSILLIMRKEQRDDIASLGERFDEGFAALQKSIHAEALRRHAHELDDTKQFGEITMRVKEVERPLKNINRTLRWLGATAVIAILGGAADAFFNHVIH